MLPIFIFKNSMIDPTYLWIAQNVYPPKVQHRPWKMLIRRLLCWWVRVTFQVRTAKLRESNYIYSFNSVNSTPSPLKPNRDTTRTLSRIRRERWPVMTKMGKMWITKSNATKLFQCTGWLIGILKNWLLFWIYIIPLLSRVVETTLCRIILWVLMNFGWVVGYTPGVLKMNTQIEQFPYPRPIMFNFQLLRNDDHKQIHKSKYWFDNFFWGAWSYTSFFWGGGQKTVCFNNCVLSTPSVQGWTQHTRLRSEIDVHLGKLSQEL